MELLGPLDAAERQPRGTPRLAGRQAATAVLVFEQQQMRRHLAIEARFLATRPDDVEEPAEEPPEAAHHSPSLVSSRLTRPAERCHQAACSARARVPVAVIA